MSDTEQLFVLAGVWVAIAAVIARFISGWPARIVVFTLLVGIPFWELPYGYYNFRELCKEQAKLQVFERIPPQDSICVGDLDSLLYARLVQAGFTRIEVNGGSDDPRRDKESGRVFATKRELLGSSFCIAFESNIHLPWGLLRHDVMIVRASDNRVVARQSRFNWSGMWWQQQAKPVLGRGGTCSGEPNRPLLALRIGAS